ncbi:hypothetical protein L1080_033575 [Rhodococcus sp. MSC1_016]|nr:hypothetical protein [Rhodococcus sp. MSC1_016]
MTVVAGQSDPKQVVQSQWAIGLLDDIEEHRGATYLIPIWPVASAEAG